MGGVGGWGGGGGGGGGGGVVCGCKCVGVCVGVCVSTEKHAAVSGILDKPIQLVFVSILIV